MSDDAGGSATAERGLSRCRISRWRASRRTDAARSARSSTSCTTIPTAIPLIVLLVGVLIFAFAAGSRFFAPFNLSLVLQQVTIIATLGIAQTLVILTAGIDLRSAPS